MTTRLRISQWPKMVLLFLGSCLVVAYSSAHSEHDKARFVSSQGEDIGLCDKVLRPCKTIAYAVKHANKGDRVLVADGEYHLKDVEDIFLLTSGIVPVMGGYNRFDHYQSQAPQLNKTLLVGVPVEFADGLTLRGFRVITDGIGQYGTELDEMLSAHQSLQQSHSNQACEQGKSGSFNCENIDLVSHMALGDFSSSPSTANDIWGHVDLNTGTEYALIGLRNGTAVVSLADPENPLEVGVISGSGTSWRDIKVYQWFDSDNLRWKAHAYVVSEGSDKVQIIDLSQLPNSVVMAATDNAVLSAHNIYISHVDYSTNTALDGLSPALHIVGQDNQGGAFKTYGLADPKKLNTLFAHSGATRDNYTHDAASMVVGDSRAQSSCQTSLCTVLMDFNENSMSLWNISNQSQSTLLADVTYDNAHYVHSGWWSEDKRYVFVHDELDEQRAGLNTTLRVFNLDNLKAPSLVKVWTGPTKAIDHNGYVRGNRYYMSNYQRGVTILDISDPTDPQDVGYFDTFPSSDSNAFNGVWGVYPYLPSGLILASDITSGLYVLRDNTLNEAFGSSSFSTKESTLTPGESVTVTVNRPAGTGAVSVGFETLGGSGVQTRDFEPLVGRLTWGAGDNTSKTITINTIYSGQDKELLVFVRLFDPQGGLTLSAPSYHTLRIGVNPAQPGVLGFADSSKSLNEGDSATNVSVVRLGGSSGEIRLDYSLVSGSADVGDDIVDTSGQLVWADGDSEAKTIKLTPIEDSLVEGAEQFKIELKSVNGSELSELAVTIIDNERANTAPSVSAGESREVNAGETVTLMATATDAENDPITYLWELVEGNVSLSANHLAEVSFVAPSENASLSFRVTATDSFGASSQASVTIQVKAAVVTPPTTSGSSGGGGAFNWLALFMLSLIASYRRTKLV
ncbi:choice-of-anchor B family protein [Shewanella sp. D64]|uniref:choice-of-anchor B family protein n=1 Tax=unclassified Shewanella TaxID=196818 RepID=UPI0022BA58C7|nr:MULTISPECIES: choice-of-anchor B family protein [unclassified Shewanella]MEC4727159.1 choice-of-anchor B family protein [Shewanella sp. D64]MEC4739224.1 choice-of-anchor B family protein [Shewanella sp. E94]WBJ95564.1 choice-of-anchor B family protein [Shewanella sp. MTB7]